MTRRALSPDLTADHTMEDLPTSRVQFFHEREARAVEFLCFLRQKGARERDGNERRRTLRKSNHNKARGKGGGGGGTASIPCTFLNFCEDDVGDGNENVKK